MARLDFSREEVIDALYFAATGRRDINADVCPRCLLEVPAGRALGVVVRPSGPYAKRGPLTSPMCAPCAAVEIGVSER